MTFVVLGNVRFTDRNSADEVEIIVRATTGTAAIEISLPDGGEVKMAMPPRELGQLVGLMGRATPIIKGPTTRPERSSLELKRALQHIRYERHMLDWAATELANCSTERVDFKRNALLESFLIHARVLRDFLYFDQFNRPHEDDVIAADYFDPSTPQADVWEVVRRRSKSLLKPTSERGLYRRANKHLGHLTYPRIQRSRPVGWNVTAIHDAVNGVLSEFRRLGPMGRINSDSAWKRFDS